MEIKHIKPLVSEVPNYLSPSKINGMLKCPLSALYENSANHSYRPSENSVNSLMGNLIHHVYNLMNTPIGWRDGFDTVWNDYEDTHSPDLKQQFNDYGKYKHNARIRTSASIINEATGESNWTTAPETMITDFANRIKGKPDLVMLRDGKPWAIKDYKTGHVTSSADQDIPVTFEDLKPDYQRQLYLYARLVFSKYGIYPKYLTIAPVGSPEISGLFNAQKLADLLAVIKTVRQQLETVGSSQLANPTEDNCRFCNFKPGCNYRFKAPGAVLTDIECVVQSGEVKPYGNLTLLLNDGTRVFERQPGNYVPGNTDKLKNATIFLSNLICENGSKKLFLTTRYTKLYVKDAAG